MAAYGEPSTSGRLRERGAGSADIPPKISLAAARRGRPRHARGAVPRWARRIIAVRAESAGARVSFRIIGSRREGHRSIARAKPVLGGRVRAGGRHARSRETRPSDVFVQWRANGDITAPRGARRGSPPATAAVSGPRTWAGWPVPDPARGSEPSGPPGGAPGTTDTPQKGSMRNLQQLL